MDFDLSITNGNSIERSPADVHVYLTVFHWLCQVRIQRRLPNVIKPKKCKDLIDSIDHNQTMTNVGLIFQLLN